MMDAHADGVTHLTLQTPANLVRRQATGEWATESASLRRARLIYDLFRIDFDDVDWVTGTDVDRRRVIREKVLRVERAERRLPRGRAARGCGVGDAEMQ